MPVRMANDDRSRGTCQHGHCDQLAAGLYRVDIRVESTYRMGLVYRLDKDDSLVLSSITVRGGLDSVFSNNKAPDKIDSNAKKVI